MYGWMTFYHQGHEMANDSKGQMRDLQIRLQKVRGGQIGEAAGGSWSAGQTGTQDSLTQRPLRLFAFSFCMSS